MRATTPKPCTTCKERDALGAGAGKIKQTCAVCIAAYMADNVCPACRGVDLGAPEHVATCDGKLPTEAVRWKAPKPEKVEQPSKPKSKPKGTSPKTGKQIGMEAAAQKQSQARRRRGETAEERIARVIKMKEEAAAEKAAKAEAAAEAAKAGAADG
jgi:hypothetical protein